MDIEYRREGGAALLGRLFTPRGEGPFPGAIDVHGGAWVQGDRTGNDSINLRLAQRGVVVFSADHRLPPAGVHPAAVQDINYAVRWLKTSADSFRTRPDWVGLTGTSAGGHLALLAALKPQDPQYAALALEGAPDAGVAFCVALWPVVCPLRRYLEVVMGPGAEAARAINRVAATTRQMNYWLTEGAMKDGSPLDAVARGDEIARPPVLIVQSPADPLHPVAQANEFIAAYRKRGGAATLHEVAGEPYYLVRADPDSAPGRGAIEAIAGHIARHTGRAV